MRRPAAVALIALGLAAAWRLRTGAPPAAPGPEVLALNERRLAALHAREDAALGGYGWVDKKAGIARIPLERAIELSLRKGYPVRAAPSRFPRQYGRY